MATALEQALEAALPPESTTRKESTSEDKPSVDELKKELWQLVKGNEPAIKRHKAELQKIAQIDGPPKIIEIGTRGYLLTVIRDLKQKPHQAPATSPPGAKTQGIPACMAAASFATLAPRIECPSFNEALNDCRRWTEEDLALSLRAGAGIVLCGDVGTGKTALAVAALKEAARQGHAGQFVRAADLVRNMNGGREAVESYRREMLMLPALLVIDDLGSEYQSQWSSSLIDDTLLARYDAMKSTIITANHYESGLAKAIDGRVWDRLKSRAIGIYELRGESFRENAGNAGKTPDWRRRRDLG